jgi:hypothetical protein
MVDSSRFYNVGGSAFDFKSGNISGTAAGLSDEKMGQGSEYGVIENGEDENFNRSQYVDRSAQLRATLNSLAMLNVANVLNERKRLERLSKKSSDKTLPKDFDYLEDEDEFGEEFLNEIEEFEKTSS